MNCYRCNLAENRNVKVGQNKCTRKEKLMFMFRGPKEGIVSSGRIASQSPFHVVNTPGQGPHADQTDGGDHELKMKLHIYITTVYCILGLKQR